MARDATLLVASTGGHLEELVQLAPRIEPDPTRRVWATFDTSQSRSLLDGEEVEFVHYMAPRQWGALATNFLPAIRIMRRHRPSRVFSTGAGIALSFLPIARLTGIDTTYIESAARTARPSMTGSIIAKVPGIATYTQYDRWANGRWRYGYSVFDDFSAPTENEDAYADRPRIVVQVGTLDFPFDRLIAAVQEHVPDGTDITWQLGPTPIPDGLPGESFDFLPAAELSARIRNATAVVSHAGCGSALMALRSGVRPILVPRSASFGEHIDEHQVELAEELAARGVATWAEPSDIDRDMLSRDHRMSSRPTERQDHG